MSKQHPSLISLAVDAGIATLTLNRPPVNALSQALLHQLATALDQCATDPGVRVIVIASSSSRVFSAGADVQELKELDSKGIRGLVALGQGICSSIESIPKVTIAAVEGVAVGGGCELAMACDLRVAGQSARFGQPEVNLGIIPGWGGTQRLPRLLGKGPGLELLLTGEPVAAERGLALGLVNRVVPQGQALQEAHRMAQGLLAKPPLALRGIKEAVNQGLERPLPSGLALEAQLFSQTRATLDAQEGIQAFLEKRTPHFQGQ